MADSGLRAALMETIGGLMATDQVVLDLAKIRFCVEGIELMMLKKIKR